MKDNNQNSLSCKHFFNASKKQDVFAKSVKNPSLLQKYSAFTLIELLIVLAILAILFSVSFGVGGSMIKSSKNKQALADIGKVDFAVKNFRDDYLGKWPVPSNLNGALNLQVFFTPEDSDDTLVATTVNPVSSGIATYNASNGNLMAVLLNLQDGDVATTIPRGAAGWSVDHINPKGERYLQNVNIVEADANTGGYFSGISFANASFYDPFGMPYGFALYDFDTTGGFGVLNIEEPNSAYSYTDEMQQLIIGNDGKGFVGYSYGYNGLPLGDDPVSWQSGLLTE